MTKREEMISLGVDVKSFPVASPIPLDSARHILHTKVFLFTEINQVRIGKYEKPIKVKIKR